jgi:predicted metalloprotease
MLSGMPRRAAAALSAVLPLVLSGCATIVIGEGSPLAPPVVDAAEGEVPITGADDSAIDELARNALADLESFWAQQFPEVYGEEFPPLQGGYFSVDPDDVDTSAYPDGVSCGSDPREVEDNAFYCQADGAPNSDSITYDRSFLAELADQFGPFIPDLVMAHEFGHAVQARVGFPPASIVAETQADCFAGAWTAWVAAGEAEHTTIRQVELDELLRGYLQLRDPVGTSLNEEAAHGSYFDRVSAFQEGFADGVGACRDNFTTQRIFTQGKFSDEDLQTGGNAPGNAPYDEIYEIIDDTLPEFWDALFTTSLGARFEPPVVERFQTDAPGCAPENLDLVYCADEGAVGIDEADLARDAYEIGDFAVATAVSIPYALAARDQRGLSTDDAEAIRSAVCLTGSYGFALFAGDFAPIGISPGDLDESVIFLLSYGTDPDVLPDVDLTGFELVDVFRTGFVVGSEACGIEG